MSARAPTLWMVPVPLMAPGQADESMARAVLPAQTLQVIAGLRHFVVENAKTARAILKPLVAPVPIQEISILELDKHHSEQDWDRLLAPLKAGHDLGVLSESGCPGIADPGALLARQAHGGGFAVKPLIGPSSILLAVMAGGLGGQQFRFNGYLPQQPQEREKALLAAEKASAHAHQTELWIETPYRNLALFQAALKVLRPETWLSLALDLNQPQEQVMSMKISQWQAWARKHPARTEAFKQSLVVFSILA